MKTIGMAAALAALTFATGARATDTMPGAMDGPHMVQITYENLTTGQVFSPAVFLTHNASAPMLFKEGEPASFGLMRIAEEGNAGPLLSAVVVPQIGAAFGTAMTAISILPGQRRTLEIEVTKDHPMLSGAWMLVQTNDGFTGVNGVDAYAMKEPVSMDLMAYEAGTERNNEQKPYLVAMMGTDRDPEGGVVQHHAGIRGDADLPPERRFNPMQPVARITFTPMMGAAMR